MIAYIQGTVLKKFEKAAIIQAGQIGYLVNLPAPTLANLNEKEDAEFFIETRVREDDISLYGFKTLSQQDLFQSVTSISGVGAKIGMEILAEDPEKIKAAIIAKDAAYLTKINGIGKRTAERMIVELKNKLTTTELPPVHQGLDQEQSHDVTEALISLGYQKYEINKVLKRMPDEIVEVEEIVTYFLQNV